MVSVTVGGYGIWCGWSGQEQTRECKGYSGVLWTGTSGWELSLRP